MIAMSSAACAAGTTLRSAPPTVAPSRPTGPTPTIAATPTPAATLSPTQPEATLDGPLSGLIALDVAYDPNGDTSIIAVVKPDGTGYRELTKVADGRGADPSWSRSEPGVIYYDNDTGQESHIYRLDVTGSAPTPVTSGSVHDYDPIASPDGNSLAFDRSSGGPAAIMILDLRTHALKAVTAPPASSNGGDLYPDWSPDGALIAFERDGAIDIVDLATGRVHEVVPSSAVAHRPKWSPDGSWILFGNPDDQAQHHLVQVVHPDGVDLTALTTAARYSDAPAWSPDGGLIVWIVRNPTAHDIELWIMTATGGSPMQAWHSTPNTDMFPSHPSWGATP
jgi:Tol biopolymer transport system component